MFYNLGHGVSTKALRSVQLWAGNNSRTPIYLQERQK